MNLHITPSFNIDRLCKTASVLLFLVYNCTTFVNIPALTLRTHVTPLVLPRYRTRTNSGKPRLHWKTCSRRKTRSAHTSISPTDLTYYTSGFSCCWHCFWPWCSWLSSRNIPVLLEIHNVTVGHTLWYTYCMLLYFGVRMHVFSMLLMF